MPLTLELTLTAGFQRLTLAWLSLFTLLCMAFAAIAPLWSKLAIQIALLLPVIHFVLFLGVLVLCSLPYYISQSPSDRYLHDHHPQIWKKLHPWGRFSNNSFTAWIFLFGGYDDGQDENLQLIKRRCRWLVLFQLWSFALFVVPIPVLAISATIIDLIVPNRSFL